MSVLTLPEPPNWPVDGHRLGRLTLIVAAFFAGLLFIAARSLLDGKYLEAVVGVGFVFPIVLAVIAVQLVARGHTALRVDHDSTGTTLRPDRTFTRLGFSMFAIVIPVGVVFVVFTLTGDLHMFPSKRAQAVAVVLAGLATGTAIWGLIIAWRRGGIGYVKLTPSRVEIADILRTATVDWDDVAQVADHSESNKKTRKAVILRRQDGAEKTIDGADFYVPNGVGLYWMVWHYWRHADDRAELTDGRALERLREGRFDTSVR